VCGQRNAVELLGSRHVAADLFEEDGVVLQRLHVRGVRRERPLVHSLCAIVVLLDILQKESKLRKGI